VSGQWQWHRADADTDMDGQVDAPSDPEVVALINREREWERRQREYQWSDTRAVVRGARNGLLICVPIWLAAGRLFGWW
jgi:hypothetical protein